MSKVLARIRRSARRSVFDALTRASSRYGAKKEIAEDADGRRLTYREIIQGSFALGSALARLTKRGEKVGLMLPSGAGAIIAFYALSAYGRIPAMLNFTAGPRLIDGACRAAGVTKIVTAHRFIELGALEELEEHLAAKNEMIYLDDLREELTTVDKVRAVVGTFFPSLIRASVSHDDPAVILFTSGTEGDPKGVVLSHFNLLSNVAQIDNHVDLEPWDILFNPLPVFHSFGLMGGMMLPLAIGRKVVSHPSPLQVKIIPKRIRETRATLLFCTDSFLQQYARASSDTDLRSIRLVVCGAERVREETRQMVKRRFDIEVLEGYGVTETSPVLAVNQPDQNKHGTVGRLLPGIESKLEPVEGLENAGKLLVRGPNIMTGYLSSEHPGEIIEPEEGWHDTGDVVSIDDEGYVTIRDRLKRFAKLSGEMVSLSIVENCASAIWPDFLHAAVALPDSRKGEQIILVSECPDANHSQMLTWARTHGVSLLAVPKKIIIIESIPLLGTGKINHVAVSRLAVEQLKEEEAKSAPPADEKPKTESEEAGANDSDKPDQ